MHLEHHILIDYSSIFSGVILLMSLHRTSEGYNVTSPAFCAWASGRSNYSEHEILENTTMEVDQPSHLAESHDECESDYDGESGIHNGQVATESASISCDGGPEPHMIHQGVHQVQSNWSVCSTFSSILRNAEDILERRDKHINNLEPHDKANAGEIEEEELFSNELTLIRR